MNEFELEGKKFKSVIRRIVWIPMVTMIFILLITAFACIYSWMNISKQLITRNMNSLEVSMAQLEGILNQIENQYVNYVATSKSYAYLSRYTKDTPSEKLVAPEGEVRTWLQNQVNLFAPVQSAFAYYQNIDYMQFKGITNRDAQLVVKGELISLLRMENGNRWYIRHIDGQSYLFFIFKRGDFCAGEWIPIQQISDILGINNPSYNGEVYLADNDYMNTLTDDDMNYAIRRFSENLNTMRINGVEYNNYYVSGRNHYMRLGILIPRKQMFMNIPAATWLLFIAAFVALIIVGIVILWLRRRIAAPLQDMDKAMKIIAEGNIDYRLEPPQLNSYNEFDTLAHRFNAMLDELEEIQCTLYETKIREQRTKLKYISQQIRPHFILNALNIIYTYDESEFHLVKKMAKYLSNYFRYIVNLRVDFVEIQQELNHIRNYLNIQKERYPNRFEYIVDCSEKTSRMLIPPLIIQTFVENCIKYGMLDDKATFIYVTVKMDEDRVLVVVADTGNGFDDETLAKLQAFLETREYRDDLGVGVQNAVERMDILYGERVDIRFENEETGGAVIKILLPVKFEEYDENV